MRSDGERGAFTQRARREQIVACAIEVIAELGYARASVRKIAERVGVAMSVVLYHFVNKDELIAAIVTDLYRTAIATIVPALERETTAVGKLRAYIRSNAAFIDANRTAQMAVLDIGLSFRSATGQRLDQVGVAPELHADLAKLDLEAILRQGVRDGEFRRLDPRLTVVTVRGALNAAVLAVSQDPAFDVPAYGEQLVTVFDLATRRTP